MNQDLELKDLIEERGKLSTTIGVPISEDQYAQYKKLRKFFKDRNVNIVKNIREVVLIRINELEILYQKLMKEGENEQSLEQRGYK